MWLFRLFFDLNGFPQKLQLYDKPVKWISTWFFMWCFSLNCFLQTTHSNTFPSMVSNTETIIPSTNFSSSEIKEYFGCHFYCEFQCRDPCATEKRDLSDCFWTYMSCHRNYSCMTGPAGDGSQCDWSNDLFFANVCDNVCTGEGNPLEGQTQQWSCRWLPATCHHLEPGLSGEWKAKQQVVGYCHFIY